MTTVFSITRQVSLHAVFLLIALFLPAYASAEKNEVSTTLFSSNALDGYDTVAYFKESKAVKGTPLYSTKYKGANWHFKNAENLTLFKATPEKFAPQFGGYCAWAVSHGYTAKGDPLQWTIDNDKLYVNYNKETKDAWLEQKDALIELGHKNWPSVLK